MTHAGAKKERTFTCADCGKIDHWLASFPKNRCVACHAASPEGQYMPTAAELRRAFGGAR